MSTANPPAATRPLVVLASASAGRRALLTEAGIEASVCVSEVDEEALLAGLGSTDVHEMTAHLAAAKAADVARRITQGALPGVLPSLTQPVLVIGADSMLALEGTALGKARDPGEVRARWARFAGNWATLVTGHMIIDLPSGATAAATVATEILAARPTPAELTAYIATGEPLAIAGSATIDGYGAPFIERIAGDHSNVIGLSLPRLRLLVRDLGYDWTDLWLPPPRAA
ncbi:MAG: Maf family nucleotide pyrophosphatase [Candidatus Nanopelagicales bacterium]